MPLFLPPHEPQKIIPSKLFALWSGTAVAAGAIPAADTLYLYPFFLYTSISVLSAQLRVITGGAGSSIKSGVWAADQTNNLPTGAPEIVDNTGVTSTTSSQTRVLAMAGTLGKGWHWVGIKTTGTPPVCINIPTLSTQCGYLVGADTVFWINALSIASIYSNAMPTLSASGFTEVSSAGVPVIALQT